MPAISLPFSVSVFHSVHDIPSDAWNAMKSNACSSNIVYAHALKLAQAQTQNFHDGSQLWIVCKSADDLQTPIDFILSCTEGPLGTYPIFIFCAHLPSRLNDDFLILRMGLLAKILNGCVPVERVYSVFSLDPVARIFAEAWRELTGVSYYHEPYYAAKITHCTRRSLKNRQFTQLSDITYDLRLAVPSDIPAVAKLCYGFAKESEPFVLTMEKATEEATLLVESRQLWVHTIDQAGRPEEIASIVAVTRESGSVAAITKVFTNPDWRSRRCAERLVRRVTQSLLKSKESVVLYVAHDNPAASKVYRRVGFKGLDESLPPVDGVDPWLEIGFDRDIVDLGHW